MGTDEGRVASDCGEMLGVAAGMTNRYVPRVLAGGAATSARHLPRAPARLACSRGLVCGRAGREARRAASSSGLGARRLLASARGRSAWHTAGAAEGPVGGCGRYGSAGGDGCRPVGFRAAGAGVSVPLTPKAEVALRPLSAV